MLTTIVTIQWVLATSLKYVFWASSESCSKSYWTLCKALKFAQNKTIDQVTIKTTAKVPFVACTRIAPEFPERAKQPENCTIIFEAYKCQVHSIFHLSHFDEKISCHFQANCGFFMQKKTQDSCFFFVFCHFWPKNEKGKCVEPDKRVLIFQTFWKKDCCSDFFLFGVRDLRSLWWLNFDQRFWFWTYNGPAQWLNWA